MRARLFPEKDFENWTRPKVSENDHWQQFVEACAATANRRQLRLRRTAHGDDPAGQPRHALPKPRCSGTRRTGTNVSEANQYVRRRYRKGWKSKGFRETPRIHPTTVLAAAGLWLAAAPLAKNLRHEKLNIGITGVANQGGYDMNNASLAKTSPRCATRMKLLAAAKRKFRQRAYNDFRLLTKETLTPSSPPLPTTHTPSPRQPRCAVTTRLCEKPLTRTISECRVVSELARKQKLITQIGTQIHSGENYRRVVDLIQRGEVGPVNEVHVWVNATYGGKDMPKARPPVPASLHYDLWLGPLPNVPYHPDFVPRWWRNWWAFGGGALADFGCHYMDLPHWALGLRAPLSAEVVEGAHPDSTLPG